jgi:hypothetical protein
VSTDEAPYFGFAIVTASNYQFIALHSINGRILKQITGQFGFLDKFLFILNAVSNHCHLPT